MFGVSTQIQGPPYPVILASSNTRLINKLCIWPTLSSLHWPQEIHKPFVSKRMFMPLFIRHFFVFLVINSTVFCVFSFFGPSTAFVKNRSTSPGSLPSALPWCRCHQWLGAELGAKMETLGNVMERCRWILRNHIWNQFFASFRWHDFRNQRLSPVFPLDQEAQVLRARPKVGQVAASSSCRFGTARTGQVCTPVWCKEVWQP